MTLDTKDHQVLTASIVAELDRMQMRRASDSAPMRAAARKVEQAKQIGGAVLFFSSLIAGGALTLRELQEKPTAKEVEHTIEEKVRPIREQAAKVDVLAGDLSGVKSDIGKVKDVQSYQIEQSAWQGDVLQHVAERKKTPPPPKPASLRAKERELIGP